MILWAAFGDQWYLGQKVTFDGANKLIIVSPYINEIDVKTDIYSDWKEWTQLYDNAKFLPAIRVTGGDPIGAGEFTGDVYFLINGWRILLDHSCDFIGVIYSDNFPSPFVQVEGTQIVTNKVSSLVNTVSTGGGSGSSITAEDVWGYSNRTLTATPAYNGPSVAQIRQEMDANSVKLAQIKAILDSMDIPTAIDIRTEIDTNSTKLQDIVNKQADALTKTDYLALS